MMRHNKSERGIIRPPRDTKYSGCRLRCAKCGTIRLTLAEFRAQVSDKPEQVWRCPLCHLIAEFMG